MEPQDVGSLSPLVDWGCGPVHYRSCTLANLGTYRFCSGVDFFIVNGFRGFGSEPWDGGFKQWDGIPTKSIATEGPPPFARFEKLVAEKVAEDAETPAGEAERRLLCSNV